MADDELHAVADELVGDRDAFFRIGTVVADDIDMAVKTLLETFRYPRLDAALEAIFKP